MREWNLSIPASESQVRALSVGDVVYLSGRMHTLRDMGHRRALEMLGRGEPLPFDLRGGCIWHCGPIVRREGEGWHFVSAGPTSSSRFGALGTELIRRLDVRFTVGKGNMGRAATEAMREKGSVYLVATGGCAAVYAKRVALVEEVHWLDLGVPEAIWVVQAERMGPLVVGVDARGRSLADDCQDKARARIREIFGRLGIDGGRRCVWWPKQTIGSESVHGGSSS
ncbi:MAG: L(+)-tartrate dehydratase subunit beta [Syntrophaceae bacterium PtaU1.Bin231]|nr:MAG: L(+)-tartrate dehydratase subunit beta [Syntrophaceae bacterium PtaU1.Bin231]